MALVSPLPAAACAVAWPPLSATRLDSGVVAPGNFNWKSWKPNAIDPARQIWASDVLTMQILRITSASSDYIILFALFDNKQTSQSQSKVAGRSSKEILTFELATL